MTWQEGGGLPEMVPEHALARKAPTAFETGPLRTSQAAPPKSSAAAWKANGQKNMSSRQIDERKDEFARHAAAAAGAALPPPLTD